MRRVLHSERAFAEIAKASLHPQRGFCASVLILVVLGACGEERATTETRAREEATLPAAMTSVEWGEWLYSSYGCAACHSVAGGPGIGPAPNNIAGTERVLADGTRALADTSYLRAAILEPSEHIPEGYETTTMPLYELSYPQVDALVDYLNHLGGVDGTEE